MITKKYFIIWNFNDNISSNKFPKIHIYYEDVIITILKYQNTCGKINILFQHTSFFLKVWSSSSLVSSVRSCSTVDIGSGIRSSNVIGSSSLFFFSRVIIKSNFWMTFSSKAKRNWITYVTSIFNNTHFNRIIC